MQLEGLAQRLSPFIPSNLRLDIFALLLETYQDKKNLAHDIDCQPSTLSRWTRDGKIPGDKYMPKILSLAIERSPKARELLQREVFEEIEHLSSGFGFPKEDRSEGDLNQLLELLDDKSRAILWHLWWNRHAPIDELRDLINAEQDFEVLSRLRDNINPQAQRILNRPVVSFEKTKVDPVTGKKVLFNWWFLDEDSRLFPGRKGKTLVDIFNEGDGVTLIAQLPELVNISAPDIEYRNGVLRIRLKRGK
jgi:hypothetical protein